MIPRFRHRLALRFCASSSRRYGPGAKPTPSDQNCVGAALFFLMIRRPTRSTHRRSSAAPDVYKRQPLAVDPGHPFPYISHLSLNLAVMVLSLIHISEPTRLGMISYAVFCLKKKK